MNRNALLPSLLALAAASAGCAGDPYRAHPSPLAPAITVAELTSNNRSIPIPSGIHQAPIHLSSKLSIHFDKDEVMRVASRFGKSDVLPPITPAEREEQDRARRIIAGLKDYLSAMDQVEKDVAAYLAGPRNVVREQELEERIRRAAEGLEAGVALAQKVAIETALQEAVRKGWKTDVDARGRPTDQNARARYTELSGKLLPDGKPLDALVLASLVDALFVPVVDRAKESAAIAEQGSALGFRVRAYLVKPSGEKALPVHCRDYDSLEEGTGPVRKMGPWGISEKDLEQFQERLRLAGEVANVANQLRDKNSLLRKNLVDFRETLRSEVRRLESLLTAQIPASWSSANLRDAAVFLRANRELLGLDDDTLKKVDDAAASADVLLASVHEIRGLITTLKTLPDSSADALVAKKDELLTTIQGLTTKVTALPAQGRTVFEGMRALLEAAKKAVAIESLKDRANQILAKVKQLTAEELAVLRNELESLPALSSAFRLFVVELPPLAARQEFADTSKLAPPTSVIVRGIGDIVDTEINVGALPADHGDRLRVYVELLRGQDNGDKPLVSFDQEFALEKMGFSPKLAASVIFVDRVNEPGGGVAPTNYKASPAGSWTVHWRMRAEPGGDGWADFWNVLDPGVGISVAALAFETNGVEVGGGGHASLFGDLIQVGYGWNANVSDDRQYWYVGVGLLETINVAGLGLKAVGVLK